MLDGAGNDVFFVFPLADSGGGKNRLIVRLAAARGEIDFPRGASERLGNRFSRLLKRFCGF